MWQFTQDKAWTYEKTNKVWGGGGAKWLLLYGREK